MKNFILFFLLFNAHYIIAQNYLKENEQMYNLVNGLKIIVVEKPNVPITEWMLNVNAGPVYENENYNACASITASLFANSIKENLKNKDDFKTEIYNDFVNFYTKNNNDAEVLDAFLKATYKKYTEQDFQNINLSNLQYYTSPFIDSSNGNIKAIVSLYGDNNVRLGNIPTIPTVDSALIAKVNHFKKAFYCPLNATLYITTSKKGFDFFKAIENGIVQWKDCTTMPTKVFPTLPIVISPFNSYKKSLKISQDSIATVEIFKPAAATYKERKSILFNLLLSGIINDSTTFLHRFIIDSLKANGHQYYYKPVKYASISKWVINTSLKDSISIISKLKLLTDSIYKPEFINSLDIIKAKNHLTQYFKRSCTNKEYLDEISLYFSITNIDFYGKIIDSLNKITLKELTNYLKNDYCKSSYTIVINADSLTFSRDSLFIETAYNVESYTFNFKKNIETFADSTSDSTLVSLAQWLKINSDKRVKINGVACDDELLGIRDDATIDFLKQNPMFEIAPESIVPTKKIRLDVYRSMTIVKKLIEMGIDIAQLSGTGKVEKVLDENNRTCQKVYCTVKVQ